MINFEERLEVIIQDPRNILHFSKAWPIVPAQQLKIVQSPYSVRQVQPYADNNLTAYNLSEDDGQGRAGVTMPYRQRADIPS